MSTIKPLSRHHMDRLHLSDGLPPSRMATFKASLRRFAALIRAQKVPVYDHPGQPSTQLKQWQQLLRMGRPMIPNEQGLLDAIVTLHYQDHAGHDAIPSTTLFSSSSPTLVSSPFSVAMGSPVFHTHQSEVMVDYTSWDDMDYEGDDVATTHRLIRGFYRYARHHLPPKDPVELAIFLVMEYHFIFDLSIKMVDITKKMKQVGNIIYEIARETQTHEMSENNLELGLNQLMSKVAILDSLPIQDAMLTNDVFFHRMTEPSVSEFVHDMMGSLSHVKQFLVSVQGWLNTLKP